MTLIEYQVLARSTAIYPNRESLMGLVYTVLKLNGEAGEVAEKLGKFLRDGGVPAELYEKLRLELGDVLWYVANAAAECGFTLEEIAQANLDKLVSRASRGKLSGSGDDR